MENPDVTRNVSNYRTSSNIIITYNNIINYGYAIHALALVYAMTQWVATGQCLVREAGGKMRMCGCCNG